EPGHELARGRAVTLVHEGIRNVIQVVRRGVAEYQTLHDRRNEQAQAGSLVLEHGEQLLARESENAHQRGGQAEAHRSRFRVAARLPKASSAAIAPSAARLGMRTCHRSPARNTVCSSVT